MGSNQSAQNGNNNDNPNYPFSPTKHSGQSQNDNYDTPASPENSANWENTDVNVTPVSPISDANPLEFYDTIKEGMFVDAKEQQNTNEVFVNNQETQQNDNNSSSPFISTAVYNNIMGDTVSSDSPFITKEQYEELMKGGHRMESSSLESLESISISSSHDLPYAGKPQKQYRSTNINSNSSPLSISMSDSYGASSQLHTVANVSSSTENVVAQSDSGSEYNVKMYGFSETSSEVIKTSDNNYIGNESPVQSAGTPYKYNLDSSSVNTSDIKLVSENTAPSNEGSRYL